MFGLSPIHIVVFALVVLVLFGRGKVSEFMGDFGKGIKSFKEGMNESDGKAVPPAAQIPPPAAAAPPPVTASTPTGEPIVDPTQTPPQA